MTTKLSGAQIQQVLGQAPEALRKLASERDFWKKEATDRMQRDEAVKVASMMHEKGIQSEVPFEELVSNLEKAASRGGLQKIAEAVDMVGPNMGEKIATLTGDEGAIAGSSTTFEQFILGGVG